MNDESYGATPRRILVVEDDAKVRDVLVRVLQEAGYTVLAASDGQEALQLAAQESRIDLLLTDVVMRGLKGPELAQQLAERQPDLRILITSSFRPSQLGDLKLPGPVEFVEKPWTPAEITERVARLLGDR